MAYEISRNSSEASIDAVNTWMRSTPWYQQLMRAWGQDPGHPTLTKAQRTQVLRMAQSQGVVVDEGHDEIDDHGNFNQTGHKLRNTLIVAGIAGAALATMGAAGVFGGAAAGAAGGGAAALGPTTAGTMAATSAALSAGAPAGIAAAGGGAAAAAGGAMAGTTFGIPNTDLFKAGTSLFGDWFGAHLQGNAAEKAAALQAAAAKYSADLIAKANADALEFQKSNAENAFLNNEASRRGNYDQDAARQRRLGFIGEEVGLGPREIPDYVPGVDPRYGSSGGGSSSGPAVGMFDSHGGGGSLPPTPKTKEEAMAIANQIAYGGKAKHTDPNYWSKYDSDPDYYFKRMLGWQAGGGDVATSGPYAGAGGGGGATVPAPRVATNTVGQTPFMNVVPVGMFG